MFGSPGRVLRMVGCSGRVWVSARGSRVFSRRPVRVHLKGAAKEAEDTLRHYEEMFTGTSRTRRDTGQQENEHTEQKTKAASTADRDAVLRNGICFKRLSEARDYERALLGKVQSQKYRTEHQLFVAEGYRIIREALQCGATPEAIYFSRLKLVAALRALPSKLQLQDVHALSGLPLVKAPYKTLQTWSSVTSSPGIVGVFKIPMASDPSSQPTTTSTTTLPLTLVLDELREPGNLGGVLRTAAAVGVHQVLLLKGCCDPWGTKVVRAGCGAHFRLRLTTKLTWNTLSQYVPEDAQVFLADVCRAEDLEEDIEDEEKSQAHKDEEEHVSSLDSEEHNVYEVDEEGNRVIVDHSYSDPQNLELYSHVCLPTLSYDQLGLKMAEGGVVLVIGGEVGVSNASKKFVSDNFGSKVTVPLVNGMDSLNVGVALGVILFEMQKQLHRIAIQRVHKEMHESEGKICLHPQ